MRLWTVRFVGKITPVNVKALTLREAVDRALEYTEKHDIPEDAILAVEYNFSY